MKKWTSLLLLVFCLLSYLVNAQDFSSTSVYSLEHGDSTLTPGFVNGLCNAARYHNNSTPGEPSLLEKLILQASNAQYNQPETPEKAYKWYTQYGINASCPSTDKFEAGNFLRQVVYSNYRDFANIIGPKNRLSLNLMAEDPADNRNLFEFVNQERISIEARHDDRRFEFQQDENWKNIMFFYFLFSEYKINYDAKLKE